MNNTTIFPNDQSDQGSIDSDYTSYVSSKLNPSSTAGSNSSLNHRPTRSTSIESPTAGTTHAGYPRLPTRHVQRSQSTRDPLQFVKIQSTQEQCQPAERRKFVERRQSANNDDEQNDWSKAVDDWRQKRMKKVQSMVHTDPPPPPTTTTTTTPKTEETPKITPIYETVNKVPSPPVPTSVVTRPKSPSPVRRKGPSKIREISMEKPLEMRGFGFKLDGGRTTNRPIFISTIEEGSPADRSGLNVDDEVLAINGQSIENLSFDQVRKILKERNLRGTIKMIIRTFEETNEDSSQSAGPSKSNHHSPVYTFLPYTPSKPARSTDLDHPHENPSQTEMNFSRKELLTLMNSSSPIEAFRQLLEPGRCTENIYDKELKDLEAEFEKQLKGIDQMAPVDRPTSTQVIINLPSTTPKLFDDSREESPISQVRSYVEKQMDQLKQDLEFGFSRSTKNVESPTTSSLKKSISTQNSLDRVPSSRGYGLVVNPNEKVLHYLEPYTPQRPLSQYLQRSIPNLPSMSMTSNPQQKKVTIQLDDEQKSRKSEKFRKQFNRMKRTHFDENLWIEEDDRHQVHRSIIPTVSGKLRCSRCQRSLGHGSAMVIESLGLYYHMECFRCFVCNVPLSTSLEGIDVRIRNHRLHCQNCFSDDRGVKLSAV